MSNDPITRVWDRIKADAEGIKFTDEAIEFLVELGNARPEPEGRPVFKMGVPEGRFWIALAEEDDDLVEYDGDDLLVASGHLLYDTDNLLVVISAEDYDLLKGCTVDYELMGLSKRLVLKHKNLERPLLAGDYIY